MKYLKSFNEALGSLSTIKGKLIIKDIQVGSKSDGKHAYLIDKDNKEYRLSRRGHLGIDDEYFYPYENKNVEVTGDEAKNWIIVDNIKPISSVLSDVRREVDNSVSNLRSGLDKELYKYCYNCGEKLEKRAAFCNECGKKQD